MCASHIVFKDYKINHTNQKKPFKSGYNIFNGIIFFFWFPFFIIPSTYSIKSQLKPCDKMIVDMNIADTILK